MDKERREAMAVFFAGIEGFGSATMRKLRMELGDEYEIYKLRETAIQKTALLTEKQKFYFLENRKKIDPWTEYRRLREKGICVTVYGEEDYPNRLEEIPNPPYVLFYEGHLPKEELPAVAIIGARSCTDYGRYAAEFFAEELAQKGIGVISGMASGIDGIAQRAAVRAGGKSFGVLGCGTDICYPASNRKLYEDLKEKGGIVSEFFPGTKPESFHFPMRNRIISGLADLILVIEAKEKSGTAITVTTALEQGKDVYAVPGRIGDPLSEGCNRLIREGAGVALHPESILEELRIKFKDIDFGVEQTKCGRNSPSYTRIQEVVIKNLQEEKKTAEKIAEQTGLEISEIIRTLSELELEDAVVSVGGIYAIRKQ